MKFTGNIIYRNRWSTEEGGAGRYLVALAIEIPAYFLLLAFVEWEVTTRRLGSLFNRIKSLKNSKIESSLDEEIEDQNVINERKYIQSNRMFHVLDYSRLDCILDKILNDKSLALVVNRLEKEYATPTGKFRAVQSISFTAKRGECFGLLGPNGAGKTTTFQMLTGEHGITAGVAHIDELNITTDRLSALRRFGYCPQFDALLDQLTGMETMKMYSRLRGVPEDKIEELCSKIIKLVGIDIHKEKQVFGYSGGTKRKLSVGIALVGFPPLLMMDEPSSGLDPGARRKLWDVISGAQKAGASVLLTSHSMEECAALCNRLAIMVNGKFKCIGG